MNPNTKSKEFANLFETALKAALLAGEKIMQIYSQSFEEEIKEDGSPITIADKEANAIILKTLEKTGLPIISEESKLHDFNDRKNWELYWLIDPIDGTKEFINRNDEFTVNIALIYNKTPIAGIISAPALNKLYFGIEGIGSYLYKNIKDLNENPDKILLQEVINSSVELISGSINTGRFLIAVSRSHFDQKTKEFINNLETAGNKTELVPVGSSLKFCLLAEGFSNIYPRFGKTFEWDIAAGHAIVRAAGGEVFDMKTNEPVVYNKPQMENSHFISFPKKSEALSFLSDYLNKE